MRAREDDLMFKKLIAVAFGAIFAVSLAVSPGANAEDVPFIKSGKAKFIQGHYRGAIADYDRAIALNPDYADAYYYRGLAKSELGDHRGAVADCDKAIELNSDLAVAYNNRGFAKSKLGDHEGAKADRKRAIELDPVLKDR